MPAPGLTTREAIRELAIILRAIGEDGQIDPAEYSLLLHWRARWKTVVYRPHLRDFTETLDLALADGSLSPDEQQALLAWTDRLHRIADDGIVPAEDPPPAWKRRTSWRGDPASDRQLAFLEDLGVTIPPGISKGDASDLIDQAVRERNERTALAAAASFATAYNQQLRQQTQQTGSGRRIGLPAFVLILIVAIGATWWLTSTPARPARAPVAPPLAAPPAPATAPSAGVQAPQGAWRTPDATPAIPQTQHTPLIAAEPWRATAPIRLRCQTVDGERVYTVVVAWADIVDPDAAKVHIEWALQPDLDAILVDVVLERDRFLARVRRAAAAWRSDVVSCTLLPDPE